MFPSPYGAKESKQEYTGVEEARVERFHPLTGQKNQNTGERKGLGVNIIVSIPLRGKRIKTSVEIEIQHYPLTGFHPLTGQKNQNLKMSFSSTLRELVSIPLRGKRIKTGLSFWNEHASYEFPSPYGAKESKPFFIKIRFRNISSFHPLTGQKNQNPTLRNPYYNQL